MDTKELRSIEQAPKGTPAIVPCFMPTRNKMVALIGRERLRYIQLNADSSRIN